MIDGHVHFSADMGAENLREFLKENKVHAIGLQCIPKGGAQPVEEDAFAYAADSDIPVYIFGGLNRRIWRACEQETELSQRILTEVQNLLERGCAGIKMLEGKPDVRKNEPIPDFDAPVWELYWDFLEKQQIPVYFHVNDPEEFWNPELVADYVKEAGWFYGEGFINNEEQYGQVLRVLKRHPNLKILFPHFFFLSADLARLSGILDVYKDVRIDVTPGVELYYNLSANIQEAKAFFHKYQDRILYGTDIGARNLILLEEKPFNKKESQARIKLIRDFLEKDGEYLLVADGAYVKEREPTMMHGLGLEEGILEKIYEGNFLGFVGKR